MGEKKKCWLAHFLSISLDYFQTSIFPQGRRHTNLVGEGLNQQFYIWKWVKFKELSQSKPPINLTQRSPEFTFRCICSKGKVRSDCLEYVESDLVSTLSTTL